MNKEEKGGDCMSEWKLSLKDIPTDEHDDSKECCMNCQRYLLPRLADYTQKGCTTTWEEGFVCIAFCHEHPPIAMRMIGLNPYESKCEEFVPKKEG